MPAPMITISTSTVSLMSLAGIASGFCRNDGVESLVLPEAESAVLDLVSALGLHPMRPIAAAPAAAVAPRPRNARRETPLVAFIFPPVFVTPWRRMVVTHRCAIRRLKDMSKRCRLRRSSGLNPTSLIDLLGRFLKNFQLSAVFREMRLGVRYNAESKTGEE